MNLFGVAFSALVFSAAAFAVGGNERGGGVPPAPVFMPEAATYQCNIKLTQLNENLPGPYLSRAVMNLSWKKGDYAGTKGTDLKDLSWRHFKLVPHGPFHLLAEEAIPAAPEGSNFLGYVRILSPQPRPGGIDGLQGLEAGLPMELGVVTSAIDSHAKTRTDAQTTAYQTLQSKKSLHSKSRLSIQSEQGNIKEQSELDVTCDRVE